jgi:hypothetical protein
MSWGECSFLLRYDWADNKIRSQLDDAWHSSFAGMALGILDKKGKDSYQSHRRMFPSLLVCLEADSQWWVLFFSFASTVFCMVWFYQLFVVHYGKYSQFVDNTCKSAFSVHPSPFVSPAG